MSDMVTYEVDGRIAILTLNRPEARNAVNGELAQAMEAAIDKMEADGEVWVGILQANTEGQGRPVFCAGADLKAISAGEGLKLSTERGGFAGFVYRRRRKPIIAAVDGLATAAGARSSWAPIWWSRRPARRSDSPRSNAIWLPVPAGCSGSRGRSARRRRWRRSSPASRSPHSGHTNSA